MERITALQQGLLAPATPAATATTDPTAFASTLQDASAPATGTTAGALGATATAATATAATPGQSAPQLPQAEVGQAEQPPGSNNSPRIAEYRTATAGSGVGPWCAYFTSWAAKQAGIPIGEQGQGFGAVSAVWDWAQRTGRTSAQPQAGNLIVWGGRHIGIVESVDADGKIHTIEGNSSDQVSRRTYGPDGGGATGYVRLG